MSKIVKSNAQFATACIIIVVFTRQIRLATLHITDTPTSIKSAKAMIDLYLFIPACFALNLTFGPSNLLALTNGAHHGVAFAATASIGRLLAFVPMIALSALGLGIILSASAFVFTIAKTIGAAYLIWLGWKIWKSSFASQKDGMVVEQIGVLAAFKKESLVAMSNPKAMLIFAAFFPQFVVAENYLESYAILGAVFLCLELVAITVYAIFGSMAARTASSKLHWIQKSSGVCMALFGFLLLLVRRPA